MSSLFAGYDQAYGRFNLTGEVSDTGKREGSASFIKKQIPVEAWDQHLYGKAGLGIIPINEKNLVKFGAIDIDDYSLDLVSLNNNVVRLKLPLVVCRTKSGGAHLYCFCVEWITAKSMRRKLREFAAVLGYGNAEIYPKQVEILVERGDVGSWINLPYFNESETKRYALDENGRPLKLDGFLKYAVKQQLTEEALVNWHVGVPEVLEGGPPCLQHLAQKGCPEGTRNNALFNFGIYCKKANPDNWKALLDEINQNHMNPPLSSEEVEAVKASLDRRDYNYKCSEQPIVRYCNAVKCRSCKFGVASGSDIPLLSSLTMLKTDPPIFFLDVEEGGRLALSAEELQNPTLFQRVCMQRLLRMPPVPKREVWRDILDPLFENATVIEVPDDSTPVGQLMQHLEDFCSTKVKSELHDGLLLGKIWTSDGRHYFRLKDFLHYLDRVKFTDMKQNKICMILRDQGLQHHSFNIKGKCVQCWSVKTFDDLTEGLEIPITEGRLPY